MTPHAPRPAGPRLIAALALDVAAVAGGAGLVLWLLGHIRPAEVTLAAGMLAAVVAFVIFAWEIAP